MADLWPYRDGILSYTALCPVRPWRRRRRRRDVGHSGGVGVRRATFDLIRSSTVDDENPLRLDRGCRDPIRHCRRNHWRDLQTGFADNDIANRRAGRRVRGADKLLPLSVRSLSGERSASMAPRETPAALGYRMPAEWEPHIATWLSWPRREGISFPDSFDRVMPVLRAMVAALIESEQVCINVCSDTHEAEARQVLQGLPMERISFHMIPTNEPWCRDHGPIFLTRDDRWSRLASEPMTECGARARRLHSRLSIGITTPGATNIRHLISMKSCPHASLRCSNCQFFIRA